MHFFYTSKEVGTSATNKKSVFIATLIYQRLIVSVEPVITIHRMYMVLLKVPENQQLIQIQCNRGHLLKIVKGIGSDDFPSHVDHTSII